MSGISSRKFPKKKFVKTLLVRMSRRLPCLHLRRTSLSSREATKKRKWRSSAFSTTEDIRSRHSPRSSNHWMLHSLLPTGLQRYKQDVFSKTILQMGHVLSWCCRIDPGSASVQSNLVVFQVIFPSLPTAESPITLPQITRKVTESKTRKTIDKNVFHRRVKNIVLSSNGRHGGVTRMLQRQLKIISKQQRSKPPKRRCTTPKPKKGLRNCLFGAGPQKPKEVEQTYSVEYISQPIIDCIRPVANVTRSGGDGNLSTSLWDSDGNFKFVWLLSYCFVRWLVGSPIPLFLRHH